jgi:signal transduction histidine kinase
MRLLFTLLIYCLCATAFAESKAAKALGEQVYNFNNQFKYEQSEATIHQFLNQPNISNDDSYYAYLCLSFTYKRLFDYPTALLNLDKALSFGINTSEKESYTNNINAEKAYILFDTHQYQAADSMMQVLAKSNYQYLETGDQSKIFMQEAYLLFQKKEFAAANLRYDVAIEKMKIASICNLPMIYGKKIQLYGAMKNESAMQAMYAKSMAAADSCHIWKYNLYTTEMMWKSYEAMPDYKNAFIYLKQYDSLNEFYNQKEHLEKITELDKKYENEKKDHELKIKEDELKITHRSITILIIVLIGLCLVVLAYILFQQQLKLKKEKEITLLHTKQLFEKTEEERKRIATDLHDSVNHELLGLKANNQQSFEQLNAKIDAVINDVRNISRNLHPVLFEELGLQISLENMIERLQTQHHIIINTEINYNKQLNSNDELQVYRIIQEALSNIIKYAQAHAAKVTIDKQHNGLYILIKDSGKGFNVKETLASTKAFGLHNIIQRSKTLGGNAVIESSDDGTTISIIIRQY